ncbi:hypothetical protein D3C81_1388400 [compost metagenome]
MQFVPVLQAEVMQQAESGVQAGEGVLLVEAPGQPGGDPQILGLLAQHGLAAGAHQRPVDAGGFVQGRALAQLVFKLLEGGRITHVDAGKVVRANWRAGHFHIMGSQLAGIGHPLTQYIKRYSSSCPVNHPGRLLISLLCNFLRTCGGRKLRTSLVRRAS